MGHKNQLHIYSEKGKAPYLITNINYGPYPLAISTETFQRISMYSAINRQGLEELAEGIKVLSKAEGMLFHYNTIKVRLKNKRLKR